MSAVKSRIGSADDNVRLLHPCQSKPVLRGDGSLTLKARKTSRGRLRSREPQDRFPQAVKARQVLPCSNIRSFIYRFQGDSGDPAAPIFGEARQR